MDDDFHRFQWDVITHPPHQVKGEAVFLSPLNGWSLSKITENGNTGFDEAFAIGQKLYEKR